MADNEFVGIINTVMPKYLRGAEDLTVRRRLLLRYMEQKGDITFNHGSHKCIWDVEYAEPPVEAYADGGQLSFARGDYYKQAELDWRGYKSTDMMTEKEMDMCKDDVMVVAAWKKKVPKILKALRNRFATELRVDGNAAGNSNRMHGSASWQGDDAGTTATERIAAPSDTFAGISTALAQYDSWSTDLASGSRPNAGIATDWPEGGAGDTVGYDYYSPKLINWSSNAWGTGEVTWLANCEYVLRKAVQWLGLTADADGDSLICLLAGDLMTDLKNSLGSKGRNTYPSPAARELGFEDTLQFDGLTIKSEFGIKPNTFDIFNVDKMELRSLKKHLFGSKGPEWSPKDAAWLFQCGFFGNMMWGSPKFHAHGEAYA